MGDRWLRATSITRQIPHPLSRASSRQRAVLAENPASHLSRRRAGDAHDVVPLRIGAIVGEFEVAGLIHRGDAGFVYAAVDRRSLTRIAIKEFLPVRLADRMADGHIGVRSLRHQTQFREGMQGFLRQARILAELDEPALVKTLETWQQHSTAYMAMPLCEGRSLEKVFRDSPQPSEPWLKTMLGPLLDALAALHQFECHACDVTPLSVVVGDGGPLLFDIGIVRRILARSPRGEIAVLDHGYAAIEQHSIDPSMPEGPWTDVYAVASIVHRAITGDPPPAPATRIDSDAVPLLSKVPEGYSESFIAAINRGLAVRPQHRPQSIAEFREALGIRSLEPVVNPIVSDQPAPVPSPPAPTTVEALAGMAPRGLAQTARRASAPIADAGHPTSRADDRKLSVSRRTARKDRLGVLPKFLGAALVVVALAGFGLHSMFSSPQKRPQANDGPMSIKAASSSEQPSANAVVRASATLTSATLTPAMPTAETPTAETPTAESPIAESPIAESPTASLKASAPAPRIGKIQFAIRPWGEIVVDGRKRGVSPPIKELSLPEGRHRIEVRNSTFSGYAGEVDVKAGQSVSIAHSFTSP